MRRGQTFSWSLLCLLCGCAAPVAERVASSDDGALEDVAPLANAYVVLLDSSLAADEVSDVLVATEDWHGAIPELTFETRVQACDGGTDEHTLCIRYVEGATFATEYGGSIWGLTTRDPATDDALIQIARGHGYESTTIEHELGHAMGLAHTGAGTLMAPTISKASLHVTQVDVAGWWALR